MSAFTFEKPCAFGPEGADECSQGWSEAQPLVSMAPVFFFAPAGANERIVRLPLPGQQKWGGETSFPRVALRSTRGYIRLPRWGKRRSGSRDVYSLANVKMT